MAAAASSKRLPYLILGALAIGGGGGTLLYQNVQQRKLENTLVVPTDFNKNSQGVIDNLFQQLGKERKVGFERLKQMEFVLLQYDTCPFCGKVKAFMDLHGIPYRQIEVDPFSKGELKDIPYKKVPVLRIGAPPYFWLVDSGEIVNALAPVVGQKIDEEINKWRSWNNEIFMRYVVLSINRSIGDTYENYKYIHSRERLSWKLKLKYLTAGAAMFIAAHVTVKKNLQKKLGRPIGDVRAEMKAELDKWVGSLNGKPFHGGNAPDVADTDIFGILSALRGHKVYDDIATNTPASPWVKRMEELTRIGQAKARPLTMKLEAAAAPPPPPPSKTPAPVPAPTPTPAPAPAAAPKK